MPSSKKIAPQPAEETQQNLHNSDLDEQYAEEGDEGDQGDNKASIQQAVNLIMEAQGPLELDLRECRVRDGEIDAGIRSDDGIRALAKAIKVSRVPITLNLSCEHSDEATDVELRLSINSIKFLADAIQEVEFPLTIYLNSNCIGDDGAGILAEAIKVAKVPLVLDLYDNDIEVEGIGFLAEAIERAQHALNLALGFNYEGVKDDGAMLLADAIMLTRVPLILDLKPNSIGNCITYIADAIREAAVPLTLNIDANNIGLDDEHENESTESVAKAIKEVRVPLNLHWYDNYMDDIVLNDAIDDNFAIDAGENPSEFLARIPFFNKLYGQIPTAQELEKLHYPSVLAALICEYSINPDNLAWKIVAAIRAIPYASYENKYSSIDSALLNAVYLEDSLEAQGHSGIPSPPQLASPMSDDVQDNGEAVHLYKRKQNSSDTRNSKRHKLDHTSVLDDGGGTGQVSYSFNPATSRAIHNKLTEYLLKISGFISKRINEKPSVPEGYEDVPGDGLCFYHAIARQLELRGHHYNAQGLQQMAINEILNNHEHFEAFIAQRGGLSGLLNYHLQRQESAEGGWADNIMMQALANAIGYVVEVKLFDLQGNALDDDLIRIVPQNDIDEVRILRLGNLENLHFVAANNIHDPIPKNSDDDEGKNDDDGANFDEGDEEDLDQYRCQDDGAAPTSAPTHMPTSSTTPNATSQIYFEKLELSDASSFEFDAAIKLNCVGSTASNFD